MTRIELEVKSIELQVKPIEWSTDEYGNMVFYGVNQMNMFVITPLKSGGFYCLIERRGKQQESFTDNDIDIIKSKCQQVHNGIVKSHCNDIFKSFTDNDINFI